jgi:hypothetical protein
MVVAIMQLFAEELVLRRRYFIVAPSFPRRRSLCVARSAKTDACGRTFAVVSTQASTDGLSLGSNVTACLK